ncbi:MAG: hypothetical protein AB9891_07700 [Anaerolineaceae bacterium]
MDAIVVTFSQVTMTKGLECITFDGRIAYIDNFPDLKKVNPFATALMIREIAIGGAHLCGDHQDQEDLAINSYELMGLVVVGKKKLVVSLITSFGEVTQGLPENAMGKIFGRIVI